MTETALDRRGRAARGRRGIGGAAALLLAVLVPAALPGVAAGQASDDIEVSVEVLPSLTVTAESHLRFGPVVAGSARQIRASEPTAAGRWRIEGEPGEEVELDFTLPEALFSDDGEALPVELADAAWSPEAAGAATTGFDAANGVTVTIPASGRLFVFLGGVVEVARDQAPGRYTGKVTLSATYAGL